MTSLAQSNKEYKAYATRQIYELFEKALQILAISFYWIDFTYSRDLLTLSFEISVSIGILSQETGLAVEIYQTFISFGGGDL